MTTILAFLQSHGMAYLVLGFTIVSIILTAIEAVLVALNDKVPGWVGTALSWVASALHFLNGASPAATPAVVVTPPKT